MSNFIQYKKFSETLPFAWAWLETGATDTLTLKEYNQAFEELIDKSADDTQFTISGLLPEIKPELDAFRNRENKNKRVFTYFHIANQKKYQCTICSTDQDSLALIMIEQPQYNSPYAKALKAGKIGTWTWDIKTGQITWSETVKEIFGISGQQPDLTFRKFLKTVHPKDRFSVLDALKNSVKSGSRYQVEHRIIIPDGKIRWMHEAGDWTRDEDNNVTKMYGIVRDITEQKNYRDTQQLLVELVNSSSDAVIIQDPHGKIKSWNDGAQRIYGYTETEILGKSIKTIVPESQQKSLDELYLSICGGKKITNYETIRKRKDGAYIYVSISFSPIFDDAGRITDITSIARDITAWFKKEQELRQAKVMLEQRVMERTMEIQERNLDLQKEVFRRKRYQLQLRKLGMHLMHIEEQERRRIATGLHDNIVQSLALAKIKTGILRKKNKDSQYYNEIDHIYTILDESIEQTRTLTFELSPPVLYEMGLAAAIEWIASEYSERYDLNITVNKTGPIRSMPEDIRNVLFQSVREICNNIVKHAHATDAEMQLDQNEDRVIIHIRDNGVGFDVNGLERHDSSGFGLFNIKDRIQYLDGSVNIESEPGTGTNITLSVPI